MSQSMQCWVWSPCPCRDPFIWNLHLSFSPAFTQHLPRLGGGIVMEMPLPSTGRKVAWSSDLWSLGWCGHNILLDSGQKYHPCSLECAAQKKPTLRWLDWSGSGGPMLALARSQELDLWTSVFKHLVPGTEPRCAEWACSPNTICPCQMVWVTLASPVAWLASHSSGPIFKRGGQQNDSAFLWFCSRKVTLGSWDAA